MKKGAAFATAVAAPAAANAYSLPDLPYKFEALEPYIDAPTMKIHHDKHHATYVGNINKATEGKEEVPILDLMADALEATPVRNSGGGHYNHAFFWEVSFLSFSSDVAILDSLSFDGNKIFNVVVLNPPFW